jgi:hypothetical protein
LSDASPELVKVATYSTPWSANLALQALEQAGLHPAVAGQYLAGAHPALGMAIGVDLLVPEAELETAREVLAALDRGEASASEPTDQ